MPTILISMFRFGILFLATFGRVTPNFAKKSTLERFIVVFYVAKGYFLHLHQFKCKYISETFVKHQMDVTIP